MSTNLHASVSFWTQLAGNVLDGKYLLGSCLEASDTSALYSISITGEYTRSGMLRMATLEPEAAGERMSLWEWTRSFEHPNLIRILNTGRTEVEGLPVIYAVMESADETLAGVFEERTLDVAEAKEILDSVLNALEYVHRQGLVHGAVEPRNILAVGETIKISSDYLQRPGRSIQEMAHGPHEAPESVSAGLSAASDLWSLGILLFAALTQQLPDDEHGLDGVALPFPFAQIIPECLRKNPQERCTPRYIWAALRSVQPPAPATVSALEQAAQERMDIVEDVTLATPEPEIVADSPMVSPVPATEPTAVEEEVSPISDGPEEIASAFEAKPFVAARPRPEWEDAQPGPERDMGTGRHLPFWLYGLLASAVVILLIWLLFGRAKDKGAHGGAQQTAASSQSAAPPKLENPKPVPTVSGVLRTAPAAKPSPPVAIAAAPKADAGAEPVNWRVIAYTFNLRADADVRLKAIQARHPELKASIFLPNDNRPPYLISLGGRMTMEQAKRFRNQAISAGLPGDTYAQNFRH